MATPAYSLDKMFTASFRGIEFLTESVSEQGGQKTVIHEFVNSNRRVVESLGVNNPSFTVQALVHGGDYVTRKKALIAAMQKRGTGQYMHPFEGRKNVYPLDYDVQHEEKNLGQALITLVFSEVPVNAANPNNLPTSLALTSSEVEFASDRCIASATDEFAAKFEVKEKSNFAKALDKLKQGSANIQKLTSKVSAVADKISETQGVIDAFNQDVGTLIATPSILASRIAGLQASLVSLITDPIAMFRAQKSLHLGSRGVSLSPFVNAITNERNKNDTSINSVNQALALAEMARAIAQLDFATLSDIADVSSQFNEVFLVTNELDMGQDLRAQLDLLNSTLQGFLNNQATQTPNTFTVTIANEPLQNVLYRYYGNIDNLQTIIALNNFIDISNVSGEIILVSNNVDTAQG